MTSSNATPEATTGNDPALNLRPLSLGEVFDRAFNLYFTHIAMFTAIIAIVIVPMALLSYFQSRDVIDFYVSLFQQVRQHPGTPPDTSQLEKLQPNLPLTASVYIFALFGLPFAQAAVVIAISKAYLGLPVEFGASYRFALSRWLSIVILGILWFFAALAAIFVLAIVAFFFGFTIAAAVSRLGPTGFFAIVGAGIFLTAFVAGLALGIMAYMTYAMSFIAVIIERVDPIAAFSGAFRRMFGADQLWRAMTVALALFAIDVGASLVTVGAGVLGMFLFKTPALYAISVGLLSLFFTPFALVTTAVFYYDIRIRREGYDLQMLADRLASMASTSATATP